MRKYFWFLALFGSLALCFWVFLPSWGRWQDVAMRTESGQKLRVRHSSKPCVYIGLPHAEGFYLSRGATAVQVWVGEGQEYLFNTDQELSLVAAHVFDGFIYLIFIAEYQPGRGVLVYQSADKSFRLVNNNRLPPQIAFPNLTQRAETARSIIASKTATDVPPPEFYNTLSAWMWSQMVTNKAVLREGINAGAVDQFWSKWRKEIAKQMSKEQPLPSEHP